METVLTNSADLRRVQVLLPVAVGQAFDYAVPPGLVVAPGDYVRVPFRKGGEAAGVVWGIGDDSVPAAKLKPIKDAIELPPMPSALRDFIEWVAAYTMMPLGMILRTALSTRAALAEAPRQTAYRLPQGLEIDGLTPKRRQVARALLDGQSLTAAELAREAGVGLAVIRAMAQAGLLETVSAARLAGDRRRDYVHLPATLGPAQAEAAARLEEEVAAETFAVTLLDGVTGSGKTEVYFAALAQALDQGRQVLVLLPEIALSTQFIDRFAARFGAAPALWHSDLTPAQRRNTWRDVATGACRVLVGARSALFLPFAELGLIVVDEEHDQSFKQEEGVIYQARDMAVVRARFEACPCVLVSATPSLETMLNVQQGRYRHLTLPARFGGAELPVIGLIDMRAEKLPSQRFISEQLRAAMAATLAADEQVLLFLNRRGYAPLTLCRACGFRFKCPNCTAWLVEHRATGRLQCHHCGHTERLPHECPKCGETDTFAPVGPGVERIAEEAQELFPQARIALLASDLLPTPAELRAMFRRIHEHEIDLIVGTQIIAKGHHFPLLTLVGVIDADLGLHGGDLRAGERTFQLLSQVSGRAGRETQPGRALLQTYDPAQPVMQALLQGDRDRFLEVELHERQAAMMPPYTRLAALIVSADDQMAAENAAALLGRTAPRGEGVAVYGPAPAPLSLLRNRFRFRLLLKAERSISVQKTISDWLGRAKVPPVVRVQVDVDPYSFM
jgi:primosomal protein N' (replication factor Y)